MDVGLDTDDSGAALGAVGAGTERTLFANDVLVGCYGSIVHDPQYRSRRSAVSLRSVRRALLGGGEPMFVSLSCPREFAVLTGALHLLGQTRADTADVRVELDT